MSKTKVSNCGNYNCMHCSIYGDCTLNVISITAEGKCNLYKPAVKKLKAIKNEQDEHTNMC